MPEYAASTFVRDRYFCEGLRWHEGRFWFSDFYAHEVCSVGMDGDVRVEVDLGDEQPSGLGWLPDGRLLVVGMTRRQVLRRDHDGSIVVHADLSDIATFHTNDMLVTAAGDAYVGNFGFDLDQFISDHGAEELFTRVLEDPSAFSASLAHVAADGTVTAAVDTMAFPNGIVMIGDTLIVAETLGMDLVAFDRADDGTLSNQRVWATFPFEDGLVAPDGIAADGSGGVWVANAIDSLVVRVVEGGEVTDRVRTTQPAFACALGGPDGRHLLVCTAATSHRDAAAKEQRGGLEMVELS